jgi:hypothetical protein
MPALKVLTVKSGAGLPPMLLNAGAAWPSGREIQHHRDEDDRPYDQRSTDQDQAAGVVRFTPNWGRRCDGCGYCFLRRQRHRRRSSMGRGFRFHRLLL